MMPPMHEPLADPPLVEALCEIRFAEDSEWDWTLPGLFYERVRGDFPDREEVTDVSVQVTGPPGKRPGFAMRSDRARLQFRRADGSAMLQIGPRLLTVNQLAPYPTWPVFRKLILDTVDQYLDAGGKLTLARIGLRYINEIPLDDAGAIAKALRVVPTRTGALDRELASFYQRTELTHDEPPGVLIHQAGLRRGDDGRHAAMLDLDFGSTAVDGVVDTDGLTAWLDLAHDRIWESFDASIVPDRLEQMRKGTGS